MPTPAACQVEGCTLPKAKPKHRCAFHLLAAEPIEDQVEAGVERAGLIPAHLHLARVDAAAWPPGFRWCSGCQTMVPLWYARGSQCKACAGAKAHARHIEKTYGITLDQYVDLKRRQGGVCAICGKKPKDRLAVDHDHHTGAVRGLLCSHDNHNTLVAIHHDPAIARRLLEYLEHPPMAGSWTDHPLPTAEAARKMGTVELSEWWKRAEAANAIDPPPF